MSTLIWSYTCTTPHTCVLSPYIHGHTHTHTQNQMHKCIKVWIPNAIHTSGFPDAQLLACACWSLGSYNWERMKKRREHYYLGEESQELVLTHFLWNVFQTFRWKTTALIVEDKHLGIRSVQMSWGLYPSPTHSIDFISLSLFGDLSICIEVLQTRDSVLLDILLFCSWQTGHAVKLQACFLCGCEQLGLISALPGKAIFS